MMYETPALRQDSTYLTIEKSLDHSEFKRNATLWTKRTDISTSVKYVTMPNVLARDVHSDTKLKANAKNGTPIHSKTICKQLTSLSRDKPLLICREI